MCLSTNSTRFPVEITCLQCIVLIIFFLAYVCACCLTLSRLQMGWSCGAVLSTPNIAPQFRPIPGLINSSELRPLPACSFNCVVGSGLRCKYIRIMCCRVGLVANACLAHHRLNVMLYWTAEHIFVVSRRDSNFLLYHTMDNELRKVAINFLQELDNDRFSKFYFKELAAKYRRFSRQPGNRNR